MAALAVCAIVAATGHTATDSQAPPPASGHDTPPADPGLQRGNAFQPGYHAVPGVEQAQPAAGPGPGQEPRADADPAQGTGDLVVQVDGAGQGVRLGVALQQGDRNAEAGEQQGGGAADRAGADDEDAVLAAGMELGAMAVFMVVVPFSAVCGRFAGAMAGSGC